jgi:FAD/FMN-containing dehydrogenase
MDAAAFQTCCGDVSKGVFEIVAAYRGSVSAEHGVGTLKKDYLPYSRSAAELGLMKQLKLVFDPNSIMNPGKVFD